MRILPVFAAVFLAIGFVPHSGHAAAGGNGNGGGDHAAAAITAPAVTTAQVGVTAAAKEAAVEDRRMQARTIMVTRTTALWPALQVH